MYFMSNDIIHAQVHAEYDLNGLSACEQEQIARQILFPKSGYDMHVSNLFYTVVGIACAPEWASTMCVILIRSMSVKSNTPKKVFMLNISTNNPEIGQCTEESTQTNHRELLNCKRRHSVCGRWKSTKLWQHWFGCTGKACGRYFKDARSGKTFDRNIGQKWRFTIKWQTKYWRFGSRLWSASKWKIHQTKFTIDFAIGR